MDRKQNKICIMAELNESYQRLDIKDIDDSPWQGRIIGKDTPSEDSIDELADSIEKNGLLQPITVRPLENGKYELIDGHRRMLAHKKLGRGQIKAIIKNIEDKQAQVYSIIANLDRKNLNRIETALAYKKILDAGLFENQRELSTALAKDETFVGDTLKLLKLDNRIIDDLAKNNTIKDVRLLRTIRRAEETDKEGYSELQYDLYKKVINENLSRAELNDIVSGLKNKDRSPVEITRKQRSFDIKLHTGKLSQLQADELKKVIDEKLREYLKDVVGLE